jgi:hypothetical protein
MKDREGYVYVFGPLNGYYKIGRARNVATRLQFVRPKLPVDVELVLAIRAPNMVRLETVLHQFFVAKRGRGEWFKLSAADLRYFTLSRCLPQDG